jgi:hypothetical protein
MSYPKTWSQPSGGGAGLGVGESGVRQLQASGTPFATKAGPDSTSYLCGNQSKVVLKGGQDGWYSTSDTANDPTYYVGSAAGRGLFSKRGTLASSGVMHTNANIFAMGRGWGAVIQTVTPTDLPGFYTEEVRQTFNGAKTSKSLFRLHGAPSVWDYVGFAGTYHYSFQAGKYHVMLATAAGRVSGLGHNLQVPAVSYGSYDNGTKLGTTGWLALPFLPDHDKRYTFCDLEFILPSKPLIWYAEDGSLPEFYYLNDFGSWQHVVFTDSLFPGATVPMGSTSTMITAHSVSVQPLTTRLILVCTYFFISGVTHVAETVFDIDTGSVVRQFTEASPDFIGATVLGQHAWLRQHAAHWYVTLDDGGSFADVTAAFHGSYANTFVFCLGRYTDTKFCEVVWTGSDGGDKVLWSTKDNFATVTKRATIAKAADIHSAYDYINVARIGTAETPEPMDPTFPWRLDERVTPPDWYMV